MSRDELVSCSQDQSVPSHYCVYSPLSVSQLVYYYDMLKCLMYDTWTISYGIVKCKGCMPFLLHWGLRSIDSVHHAILNACGITKLTSINLDFKTPTFQRTWKLPPNILYRTWVIPGSKTSTFFCLLDCQKTIAIVEIAKSTCQGRELSSFHDNSLQLI